MRRISNGQNGRRVSTSTKWLLGYRKEKKKNRAVFCNKVNKLEGPRAFNKTIQWYEELQIQGWLIKFKLDTRAEANVIPFSVLKEVGLTPITVKKCKKNLINYSGTDINAVDKINLLCKIKSIEERNLEFFVVNNNDCVPILGLDTCVQLQLINRVDFCQRNPNNVNVKWEIEKNL
ncbi:Aspartic peptidase domain [Cinara cedri]|uniref:Aspartic peptidase domain n=1 Tax=Cinara cedri TaxID=506608 RepID=A0A5E4N895_9HEMI|nr:Aspartic peptidase domain [Cinara cedri]